jgi:hypothetical protein
MIGECVMKKLLVILFAIFASVIIDNWVMAAANEGNIPLSALARGYSFTVPGSFATCLSPIAPFPEESCTTTGALVISLQGSSIGEVTRDSAGNACVIFTGVFASLPVGAAPPTIEAFHTAIKLLNYDARVGVGDEAFTDYSGGKCDGANFDSTGATVTSSGTEHFVTSKNGKRIDTIFTSFTDPVGGIGGFSVFGVELQQ